MDRTGIVELVEVIKFPANTRIHRFGDTYSIRSKLTGKFWRTVCGCRRRAWSTSDAAVQALVWTAWQGGDLADGTL